MGGPDRGTGPGSPEAGATSPPIRVAYIGALGRSGSTLLSRALDQVPGWVSVGELSTLWRQGLLNNTVCSCGSAFADCAFWQSVGQIAFGGWESVDAREMDALRRHVERVRYLPLLLSPVLPARFRGEVERYQGVTLTLYRAIGAASGARIVVDNSKTPSRVAMLRGVPGLDLRVTHLVRSSYGVCHSWSKRLLRADTHQPMLRSSVMNTAVRWTAINRAFELLARLGTPSLLVRYENFAAAPGRELRRILDFVEVPQRDDALAFVDGTSMDLGKDHSIWGNPMRMAVGRVSVRPDEEWRTAIRPRDRRIVNFLTAPGMRRYGYSRDHCGELAPSGPSPAAGTG